MKLATAAWAILSAPLVAMAAPPLLDVPHGQLGLPGSRVAPNLLLHLSLTFVDAGAAYRDDYIAGTEYAGYFNPRLCYSYPSKPKADDPAEPEYFSPAKAIGAKGQCTGATFSGNLLNWASMSRIDLLRHALTGGDRIIDEPGLTVLQRAWLPDGTYHVDFHANPTHFPRKAISGAAALTPFSASTLYIVSCRNRILFTEAATGGTCDKPAGKLLGEFNVRVKVCDRDDGESRPQLCKAYREGFKPEGAIQENASFMQVGAMGYLTEASTGDENFYGGALRAPIKFVGPEWDAGSGVLRPDPDGAGEYRSGLLNYVNLVGRQGRYKIMAPGAELFYEGLRYLQGRAPSPGSADAAADDGFAVWSARSDPVTEGCQRSVAAVIGHSRFASDWFVPGNTKPHQGDKTRAADNFHGSFDVMQSMCSVGASEADESNSYYIAGAAYWAHTNAIRPDAAAPLDTLVLELDAPAKPGSSPLSLAAKYGSFVDRNGDKNPSVTAAGEVPDSEWSLDGSTPAGLFPGAEPHALGAVVRELFSAVRHARGHVISHAATAPGYLVQASYDRQQSSGTLRRYSVDRDTAGQVRIAAFPTWDAAQVLPPASSRKIYTFVYDRDARGETTEFKWSSLPDSSGMGEARVNFLRGDRSLEVGNTGGVFRRRATALGDIVHSKPVIVGAPSASVQGIGYLNFHATHKNRRSVVYVGANDGMLHAFDAITGVELFAYVPAALHPSLNELSKPGYVHRSYVDGSPGVGEALVRGKWRTVLASGMGMGARGVFALDATNPSSFGGALWEFTERDDASIGHVTHAPLIAKIKIGVRDGEPQFGHFVVVASGINNYKPDSDDDAARGALFLLSLDKPASEKWKRGVNYYKLVTPMSEAGMPNALAPPGFALAPDGSVRFAYAGDLQGNVWRFDLTGNPPWTKAVGPGAGGQPLFVARDADGNGQPITHAPRVAFAPGGGYLVLFGTGKFIENADLDSSTFSVQSLYAVRDSAAKPAVLVGGRGELARRSVSGTGPYTVTGEALRFEGSGARKGWYIDLPNWLSDGERAAATPLPVSGALILDTLAPGSAPCAPRVARTYVIDAVTGLAYTADGTPANAQITGHAVDPAAALSPPLLFDLGMVAGQRDATGAVAASHSVAMVRARNDGKPPLTLPVTVKTPAGRLSWREVANWQELHDAAKKERK